MGMVNDLLYGLGLSKEVRADKIKPKKKKEKPLNPYMGLGKKLRDRRKKERELAN